MTMPPTLSMMILVPCFHQWYLIQNKPSHSQNSEQISSFAIGDKKIATPFQYLDLGKLAYTGSGLALAQTQQVAPGKGNPTSKAWNPVLLQIKGKLGFGLWRSVYLLKQTSSKNIILATLDWIKLNLFGRDISILCTRETEMKV